MPGGSRSSFAQRLSPSKIMGVAEQCHSLNVPAMQTRCAVGWTNSKCTSAVQAAVVLDFFCFAIGFVFVSAIDRVRDAELTSTLAL